MATEVKTTLAAALAALLIASAAHAAEVLEQPQDVLRTDFVEVEWAAPGGSPAPQVVVEHRHGLFWVTEASAETGDVLVADEGEDALVRALAARLRQPRRHPPDPGRGRRLRAHDGPVPRPAVRVRHAQPGPGEVAARPLPAARERRVRARLSPRLPRAPDRWSPRGGRSCASCATGAGWAACCCATATGSSAAAGGRRGFRGTRSCSSW